jgi:hypothetical protein
MPSRSAAVCAHGAGLLLTFGHQPAGAAARSGVPARMRPVRLVPDGVSFGAAGSLRPHPSVPCGGGLLGWPA